MLTCVKAMDFIVMTENTPDNEVKHSSLLCIIDFSDTTVLFDFSFLIILLLVILEAFKMHRFI